ncbi:MAG TPA: M23 family metallopeptidase [Nitrospiraceae bacterium]|nr:M23 family metallopeptidase [Nitrospiraceae bacterium]
MTVNAMNQGRRAKSRLDRLAISAMVLLASVFPVNLLPSAPHETRGTDGQFSGKQGQVLMVRVPADGRAAEVVGRFLGRHIPFFRDPVSGEAKSFMGLVGIDLQDPPGTHELAVEARAADRVNRLSYNVLVIKEEYPVQHLTLPRDKVELDEDSLVRVKGEQEQVRAVLEAVSRERLWDGRFIEPVQGPSTGAFGRMRIINGQPHSPHNGEDIAASLGTEVVATNDGIARLTVDHFFSGKGVIVDHGLGLYSMYFHLSEVTVRDGESIKRGQVIGKVGQSGRATGPHLHWGVRLNGARVDPYALLKLPLSGMKSSTPREASNH